MNIGNGKRARKYNDQPFFDWWRNLHPVERGTKANKELFYSRKHQWEAQITALPARLLPHASYRVLRSIIDLLTFETDDIAEAGTARVSLRTLAKRCAMSPGAVNRAIKPAETLGIIRVERSAEAGSHDACNIYMPLNIAPSGLALSPDKASSGLKSEVPQDSNSPSSGLTMSPTPFTPYRIFSPSVGGLTPDGSPPPSASQESKEGESETAREASKVPPPSVSGVARAVGPSPWSDSPPFLPSGNLNGYSARHLSGAELFGIPGLSRRPPTWGATAGSSL